jgi:hypothetical protein
VEPLAPSASSLVHCGRGRFMGVWQGVAMDSIKFHLGPPCPTLLRPSGRLPLTAVSGVARPQAERSAVVFYPFGHSYAYIYIANRLKQLSLNSPKLPQLLCLHRAATDYKKNPDYKTMRPKSCLTDRQFRVCSHAIGWEGNGCLQSVRLEQGLSLPLLYLYPI